MKITSGLLNTFVGFSLASSSLFAVNAYAADKLAIDYGLVKSVQITTPDSNIAESAIAGGIIGLAVSGDLSGTLAGASAGFSITSALEGDRRVYLYTLEVNKKPLKILMGAGGLSEGQCIAVEKQGKHTNLRAVASNFCQSPLHKALTSDEVVAMQQSQAKACDKARRNVLSATTDDAIDHALVKVRALCE